MLGLHGGPGFTAAQREKRGGARKVRGRGRAGSRAPQEEISSAEGGIMRESGSRAHQTHGSVMSNLIASPPSPPQGLLAMLSWTRNSAAYIHKDKKHGEEGGCGSVSGVNRGREGREHRAEERGAAGWKERGGDLSPLKPSFVCVCVCVVWWGGGGTYPGDAAEGAVDGFLSAELLTAEAAHGGLEPAGVCRCRREGSTARGVYCSVRGGGFEDSHHHHHHQAATGLPPLSRALNRTYARDAWAQEGEEPRGDGKEGGRHT